MTKAPAKFSQIFGNYTHQCKGVYGFPITKPMKNKLFMKQSIATACLGHTARVTLNIAFRISLFIIFVKQFNKISNEVFVFNYLRTNNKSSNKCISECCMANTFEATQKGFWMNVNPYYVF